MHILTAEDIPYDLTYVPEEIDDIHYCVLDYTDKKDVDYVFVPLVFLEIFTAPAVVLQIGKYQLKMPLDWSVVICEPDCSDPEIIPLSSLNDRGFKAFTFNPRSGFLPKFHEIEIVNVYQEVKWHFPKLRHGHILAVPLSAEEGAPCAYFVKETTKVPDTLDSSQLW